MKGELIKHLEQSLAAPTSLKGMAQKAAEINEAMKSFLLLDCSGSMGEHCEPGRPKITALREIVTSLRDGGLVFTQVVFPGNSYGAEMSTIIHDPMGSTPLHAALEVANLEDAKHVVVISDGMPDDESMVKHCANELKRKGVKIDVFYVGPYPHEGERFLKSLATMTGGKFQATTLTTAQKLTLTQDVKKALLMAPK